MLNNNRTFYNSKNTLPSPPIHQHVEMTRDQQKYCGAIIRNLKRHRDATPFLKAVDYVKLNVPDYPEIVKQPMDLTIVDTKLNAFEYSSVEEFIHDIRLIFNNCFKYNGPEAMISVLCQNVESAFEKSLKQMPINKEEKNVINNNKELSPPLSQHNSSSPPPPPPPPSSEDLGRPKREIHCPSKDYPETFTTQRKLSLANKTIEMKFCFNVLKEFKKNKYRHQMYAFLQPVDPISLNIPDYFQIIQHPMDLSTIENKLLNDEYKSPLQFKDDVLLMFNNCYTYNPPSLPIYSMAKQMEKVFQDMWATRPTETNTSNAATSKKSKSPPPKKARKSIDNNNMNDDKIAELERTIHNIRQQVESMKKTAKKPPVKRKRTSVKRVVHHSSDEEEEEEGDKSPPQQQEIIYTYKQKMALSERINRLNIDELNGVVEIIQNSMPNLKGNGDNEIELDMDKLDTNTLCQLHNFIFPNQPIGLSNTNKKQKRQHYTENATNRKIRQLENTLKKFESQKKKRNDDSSSSSSSESDNNSSSGSESD